jgi:hypothetical protein
MRQLSPGPQFPPIAPSGSCSRRACRIYVICGPQDFAKKLIKHIIILETWNGMHYSDNVLHSHAFIHIQQPKRQREEKRILHKLRQDCVWLVPALPMCVAFILKWLKCFVCLWTLLGHLPPGHLPPGLLPPYFCQPRTSATRMFTTQTFAIQPRTFANIGHLPPGQLPPGSLPP